MDDLLRLVTFGLVVLAGLALGARYIGRVDHPRIRARPALRARPDRRTARGWVPLVLPSRSTEIMVVDTRPSSMAVEGQEVLTADGVGVKVSLVVRSVVGDPIARLECRPGCRPSALSAGPARAARGRRGS